MLLWLVSGRIGGKKNFIGLFDAKIYYIRTDWCEGDRYWPVVTNIQKDVRRVVWKLDGKTFVPTRDLILPAGTHVLRAEVTTNDSVTEILVRKINVQPKAKKDVK